MPADGPRRRHRIVLIVGTRPEAIKMAPVGRALAGNPRFDVEVVLSGQHEGLAGHFADPGVRVRELGYDPRGRTPSRLRETLHALLCGHFARGRPDLVLVHGDTASAFAGALAARDCGSALGHVEAGLRSFDFHQPWPEEGNRVAIDAMSDLLFAPSEKAAANLRADWRVKGRVWITGNSGIDALFEARDRIGPVAPAEGSRKLILATCHRRENQGEGLSAVCGALERLVAELPVRVAFPLHPNRHARLAVEEALRGREHIGLLEPLGYEATVRLMLESWLILSDSGGFQEEGPALGRPVLVLREVTERPEALETGNIALVGTDPERIVVSVAALLADEERYRRMAAPALPFGDGRASRRIADAVGEFLTARRASAA